MGRGAKPLAKSAKATESAKSATYVLVAMAVIMIGGGLLQLAVLIYGALVPPHVTLSTETASLKPVFFSGDPWMVLCHNETDSTRSAGAAVQPFVRAAGTVQDSIQSGVLDCWAELPSSGLSTLDRFDLVGDGTGSKTSNKKKKKNKKNKKNKKSGDDPIAFTVANGRPPQRIPAALLREAAPVKDLVSHIKKATQVKLVRVSETSHVKDCLKKKKSGQCLLLLLGPDALGPENSDRPTLSSWLAPHMMANRRTQFAVMNATRRELGSKEVKHLLGTAATGMVLLQRVMDPSSEKKAGVTLATVVPGSVRHDSLTASAIADLLRSGDSAVAAVNREEEFLPAGTVRLPSGIPAVVRRRRQSTSSSSNKSSRKSKSKSKSKPKSSKASEQDPVDEDPEDDAAESKEDRVKKAARRAERRRAQRKARHAKEAREAAAAAAKRKRGKSGTKSESSGTAGASEAQTDEDRERERQRREEMERASLESGHIPMAADIDGDGETELWEADFEADMEEEEEEELLLDDDDEDEVLLLDDDEEEDDDLQAFDE